MEDTNRVLALLLVASIVISLGGTIVSLSKLEGLGITGYQTATDTGLVQLNITSETNIAITSGTMDFGNGFVNSTCSNCTMWSNSNSTGSNYSDASCCESDWTVLGPNASSGIWVQNQGNTNLTVNINFSANAASFIGGSNPAPLFDFRIVNDSDARTCQHTACTAPGDDTTGSCVDPGWGNQYMSSWATANTSDVLVCASGGFKPITTQDEFAVDIRVRVPRTATASQKTATIFFTGTAT